MTPIPYGKQSIDDDDIQAVIDVFRSDWLTTGPKVEEFERVFAETVETFFGWWKRHLKVYHLIARSQYGVLVQMLAGLITYLLLAIYCHEEYNEKVSIKRVRELRTKIRNEAAMMDESDCITDDALYEEDGLHAKT